MPIFADPDRAEVLLTASEEEPQTRREPDTVRRLLVLGDFSGRESREVCEPVDVARRPIAVDREDLDDRLARLSVEIRLFLTEGPPILLRPRSLEDFHPDRILAREPAFRHLRLLREGLEDPERYTEAAEAVQSWGRFRPARRTEPPPVPKVPEAAPPPPDLLEQMLETTRQGIPQVPRDRDFDVFLEQIVRPHLATPEPEDKEWFVARVEEEIGMWMRSILHEPKFQEVEAAWRGLDFLLQRLETGTELRVEVLDVTKEELARDLKGVQDLTDSGIYRILVREARDTPGSLLWSAVAGLYSFAPTVEDAALLARIARIAAAAKAPFLAAAAPPLLGCESLEAAPEPRRWLRAEGEPAETLWAALRQMPEMHFLGLCAPRFLLRLPYGARTDPAEQFSFEEFEREPAHEDYLWGNPALLCLASLVSPGAVTGLPLYLQEHGGEMQVRPCAETLLPLTVAEAMLDRGVMPVLASRERDTVRIARLQSVADPPAPLPGLGGASRR